MSFVGFDVDFKFPAWARRVKSQQQRILLDLAAVMQANRGMLFDSEGSHNGHTPWAPLVFRDGQILSARGTLRRSIAPLNARGRPGPSGVVRFVGDQITIGTKLLYARMMNDGTTKLPGGVLRAKNAQALKIPIPKGDRASEAARDIRRQSTARSLVRLEDRLQRAKSPKSVQKLREQIARAQQRLERGTGGDNFIFRKWVRIPARPFDTWTAQDEAEFSVALRNILVEVLNGV